MRANVLLKVSEKKEREPDLLKIHSYFLSNFWKESVFSRQENKGEGVQHGWFTTRAAASDQS